jgi:hypothetical protein
MAEGRELCNSGYIHGVIEAYITEAPDKRHALLASCPTQGAQDFKLWQCYHGTGHGAMFAAKRDIKSALDLCKEFPTDFAVASCANGVFMEAFIVVSHTGAHKEAAQVAGLDVCARQESEYKPDCYFYAPTAYLELHENNYNHAVEWCESSEERHITTCVSGVGAQAMKENVTQPVFAAAFCSSLQNGYQAPCVRSAISIYINHHASTAAALTLCDKEFKKYGAICKATVDNKRRSLKI